MIVTRSLPSPTLVQIPQPPLHVYQRLLPLEASTKLLHAVDGKASDDAQLMKAPNLHCSAQTKRLKIFFFFSDVNDKLLVSTLFLGHIRLSKRPDGEWEDLGPLVKHCLSATD